MKVLTDTHTLVWALTDPALLGVEARKILASADVRASVANLWELCLKAQKPNALLLEPVAWWNRYVRPDVQALPIRASDVMTLNSLPPIHNDPFDRILIAQAMTERIPLVTKDSQLARYGIPIIW